jgi:hypothetical protein
MLKLTPKERLRVSACVDQEHAFLNEVLSCGEYHADLTLEINELISRYTEGVKEHQLDASTQVKLRMELCDLLNVLRMARVYLLNQCLEKE